MSGSGGKMQDVTGATGRQILDDIFEESRMHRTALEGDLDPDALIAMRLPSDPFVGYHRGSIHVDGDTHEDGETLVVASDAQGRRYLMKRWNQHTTFKAYQQTPVAGEKLRLLNVYRVMLGQPVPAQG